MSSYCYANDCYYSYNIDGFLEGSLILWLPEQHLPLNIERHLWPQKYTSKLQFVYIYIYQYL